MCSSSFKPKCNVERMRDRKYRVWFCFANNLAHLYDGSEGRGRRVTLKTAKGLNVITTEIINWLLDLYLCK